MEVLYQEARREQPSVMVWQWRRPGGTGAGSGTVATQALAAAAAWPEAPGAAATAATTAPEAAAAANSPARPPLAAGDPALNNREHTKNLGPGSSRVPAAVLSGIAPDADRPLPVSSNCRHQAGRLLGCRIGQFTAAIQHRLIEKRPPVGALFCDPTTRLMTAGGAQSPERLQTAAGRR